MVALADTYRLLKILQILNISLYKSNLTRFCSKCLDDSVTKIDRILYKLTKQTRVLSAADALFDSGFGEFQPMFLVTLCRIAFYTLTQVVLGWSPPICNTRKYTN